MPHGFQTVTKGDLHGIDPEWSLLAASGLAFFLQHLAHRGIQ